VWLSEIHSLQGEGFKNRQKKQPTKVMMPERKKIHCGKTRRERVGPARKVHASRAQERANETLKTKGRATGEEISEESHKKRRRKRDLRKGDRKKCLVSKILLSQAQACHPACGGKGCTRQEGRTGSSRKRAHMLGAGLGGWVYDAKKAA